MRKFEIVLKNDRDSKAIIEYLAGFESAITVKRPDLKAYWLVGHAHDLEWQLRKSRTSVDHLGKVKHTYTVKWDFRLGDGTHLSDTLNSEVRRFFQEIVFCMRDNPSLEGGVKSNASLMGRMQALRCFFSWIFSPDLNIEPRTHFLSRVSGSHLSQFIEEYSTGGTFTCMRVGERILAKVSKETGKKLAPRDIYNLTQKDCRTVINFLKEFDCYTINNYGAKAIDRGKLGKLMSLGIGERYGKRYTRFLRQFEPEIKERYPEILVPIKLEGEHPSHKTLFFDQAEEPGNNKIWINAFLMSMQLFAAFKTIFPGKTIPATIRMAHLRNNTRQAANGTPWIPLPISLHILNKAIGFLLNDGDDVIQATNRLLTLLNEECKGKNVYFTNPAKKPVRRQIIQRASNYTSLNFDRAISTQPRKDGTFVRERDYDSWRKEPPLSDLVDLLYASCIIVISTLKPLRIDELLELKYNCLSLKNRDGYWLEQTIAKSSNQDQRVQRNFPIPALAARAIIYLQLLNDLSRKFTANGKTSESKYLFFKIAHLFVHKEKNHASIINADSIKDCLIAFCDYIEVPLDAYGRRWYVNIHELRKSFLLTFFWTYKHSSLDACRWIAGHSDPEHVLAYIQANIPGEEMVEVEAQYAQQQLRLFSTNQKLTELENLEKLNGDVCQHFNVKSVSMLDEIDLNDWLEFAISSGRYKIVAYDIGDEASNFGARVAIEINKNVSMS
ncbi:hypothetical protein [Marinobacter qingdaonensis]|uniref:Phage integrase family protein n=1 Tax=Marinobacter qingdaonensis TaxID=3108486 RepID=A0ABU5NTP3_9GAMM|nr:hypothetical protein [Marinobacter sp. ASW11-75]MEA1079186.1 hypothetical protein [Marinobacter sp. ASW11-75]